MTRKRTKRDIGQYRSGLEFDFATDLKKLGVGFEYEPDRIKYVKAHTYTPDFKIADNIYLETKGRLTGSDRTKMLLTREQNPGVVFIMVLQNASLTLSKRSKTTYAMWCEKNGFEWVEYGDERRLKIILSKYYK